MLMLNKSSIVKCVIAIAFFASISSDRLKKLHHEKRIILQLQPERFRIIAFVMILVTSEDSSKLY